MSTIATQLNWGASYLVNDFYRRFVRREAPERHYVLLSRLATVFLTLVSAVVTFYMTSIAAAWKLLIVTGAGTGGVLLLRWYWWRVNAWSEVSSMVAAFVVSLSLQLVWGLDSDDPLGFAWIMIITISITTAVWLATTLLTQPEPTGTLLAFYRRVRPSGRGWAPIARLAPEVRTDGEGWRNLADAAMGCVLIYGALFGVGKLLLKQTTAGVLFLSAALAAGAFIYRDLSRRGWHVVAE
ncbi:MAG: hypothetical protein NZ554_14060, partial [Bryobacteraceae bacterium]|nr:hypothetical protein [Bryobacteraceae bacterium]